MLAIKELSRLTPDRDMVITIGVFDGVHLGHRQLIRAVTKQAVERECLSGVVTFHPHPRLVLSPFIKPNYLTSMDERLELIASMGVDIIATLTFTTELAKLSASDFISMVQEHLRMRELIVGWDFALGRNREGDESMLKTIGEKKGFTVRSVSRLVLDGETVSSTAIREALAEGDMSRAAKFLGREYGVKGNIVHGAQRGRLLGFPTANMAVDPGHALPCDGVYVTRAFLDGRQHEAVTNIGRRPSFDYGDRSVEVHLLDYHGDIYGRELRIELLHFLRGEMKFPGIEDLRAQIDRDVARSRAYFAENL